MSMFTQLHLLSLMKINEPYKAYIIIAIDCVLCYTIHIAMNETMLILQICLYLIDDEIYDIRTCYRKVTISSLVFFFILFILNIF